MKVNKKDIQKWIDTLRSGKYSQAKYTLQTRTGYCCLGVACDIFIKDKKLANGILFGNSPKNQPNSQEWLANINHDFFIKTTFHLSHLNDNKNFSFDEIADLLQAIYIEGALDA